MYIRTLLALEQRTMPASLPALAITDGSLLNRVRRIMQLPPRQNHRPLRSLATTMMLLTCIIFPLMLVACRQDTSLSIAATPPIASTQPAAATGGEYYVFGHISRVGAYSIPPHGVTVRQALIAAGLSSPVSQTDRVWILRHDNGAEHYAMGDISVAKLIHDEKFEFYLQSHDVIRVGESESADDINPSQKQSTTEDRGEYYIYGDGIPRVGVYSIPSDGITMKEAIIAAGGPGESTWISVIRKTLNKREQFFQAVSFADLMSGKQPDLYLRAGDIIRVSKEPAAKTGDATTKASVVK